MTPLPPTFLPEQIDEMYTNLLAISDRLRERVFPTLRGQLEKVRAAALERYPIKPPKAGPEKRETISQFRNLPPVREAATRSQPVPIRRAQETPALRPMKQLTAPPLPLREELKITHLRLRRGYAPFFAHVHRIEHREQIRTRVLPLELSEPTR